MGIKRLGKKRLYAIEKKGALQDIGASNVMKSAIISATQHREGHKKITDIVVDLGASSANLKSGGATVNLPIGKAGSTAADVSYICKVTDATFGIVTSLKVVCLEPVTDGLLTQYNLIQAQQGNGYLGSADTNTPLTITDGSTTGANKLGTLGLDTLMDIDNELLKNKYIYVGSGAAAGTKVEATCEITGIPANLDNIVHNVTQLRLADESTTYTMVADTSTVNTAAVAGVIKLNGVTDAPTFGARLVAAINALSGNPFNSSAAYNSSDNKVTVSQQAQGAAGNVENPAFHDAPGKTSGIAVSDFTGGSTAGTSSAITGGKFLLRFEGFVVPADAS